VIVVCINVGGLEILIDLTIAVVVTQIADLDFWRLRVTDPSQGALTHFDAATATNTFNGQCTRFHGTKEVVHNSVAVVIHTIAIFTDRLQSITANESLVGITCFGSIARTKFITFLAQPFITNLMI
jgi:hypothetical protein